MGWVVKVFPGRDGLVRTDWRVAVSSATHTEAVLAGRVRKPFFVETLRHH